MKVVDDQLGAVARPARVHFVGVLPKDPIGQAAAPCDPGRLRAARPRRPDDHRRPDGAAADQGDGHPLGPLISKPELDACALRFVARVAQGRPSARTMPAPCGSAHASVGCLGGLVFFAAKRHAGFAPPPCQGGPFPTSNRWPHYRRTASTALARAKAALRALERRPGDTQWLAAYDDLNALMEDWAGPVYLLSNVHPGQVDS